jgi:glycosyltransferase involved in cell wall biosynthesis
MKIAVIHWGCARYDAISNLVRQHVLWCLEAGHETMFFGQRCDYADLPFVQVVTPEEAATHPFFKECSLVILHFGIYYPLFDILKMPPCGIKRIVVFHNITPKEFVRVESWNTIEKSFVQIDNISQADEVFCISETNRRVLLDAGIKTPTLVLPFPVDTPITAPQSKPGFGSDIVNIVFIGRFVMSKGPLDLLNALDIIAKNTLEFHVRLNMIGNTEMSDKDVLAAVKTRIAELETVYKGRISIFLLENVCDDQKYQVLSGSDIFSLPSRHEGFCVPIIEALTAGCRITAYDNSNIPYVCNGHGKLVPTGDVDRLASTLAKEAAHVRSPAWECSGYHEFISMTKPYLEQYQSSTIRAAFLRALPEGGGYSILEG